MAAQIQTALTILRRKQVEARTGLPRSSIYQRMADGTFPKPISLGAAAEAGVGAKARAVGWIESEVTAWISHQIEQSRKSV